jgi:hypothetical protein
MIAIQNFDELFDYLPTSNPSLETKSIIRNENDINNKKEIFAVPNFRNKKKKL